jgi:hypothetical protein
MRRLVFLSLLACGSETPVGPSDATIEATGDDAADIVGDAWLEGWDSAEYDAGIVMHDACPSGEASVLWRSCEFNPCPSGYVCALEFGGAGGGGDDRCMKIPDGCMDTPSCECLGNCGCQDFNRLEKCGTYSKPDAGTEGGAWILACDNGVR